ncbi:MAG: ABC transporter substrate binding protein, partial [Bacteroidales bacterium]
KEMIDVVQLFQPPIRTLGTLYSPGEANSVKNMNELKQYAEAAGLRLITAPINSASEVSDAALSLVSQKPDIVCQIVDNLTSSSFAGIRKIIRSAKIPLFGFVSDQAEKGAMVVVSRNYHQAGVDAVHQAIKILKGASPAQIPFEFVSKTDYIINPEEAAYCGLALPKSLLERENIAIIKATAP